MFANTNCARVPFLAGSALSLLGSFCVPAHAQQPPEWHLQHAGTVFDAFTLDGNEIWTVEDGGRVRHRDPITGDWEFQEVPEIRDILYRVQFLPGGLHGWVVGLNKGYSETTDGGATWNLYHLPGVWSDDTDFWDVHFIDDNYGWLLEEHGVYWTSDGGGSWTEGLLFDAQGVQLDDPTLDGMRLFSLDLIPTEPIPQAGLVPPACIGLISAKPGKVYRTTDGVHWLEVLDVPTFALSSQPWVPDCVRNNYLPSGLHDPFDAWDIDLQELAFGQVAVMVGGVKFGCGAIFTSTDMGLTWGCEPHECVFSPVSCAGSQYNPGPPGSTWRLQVFNTLYSVAMFDRNGSAIVAGYSGQHLVRNPTSAIWEDRSEYSSDFINTPDAIRPPMFATAASPGTGTPGSGSGLIAGAGGFVRHTSTGGQHWTTEVPGDSWRVQDLSFISNTTGWIVGQFYRIAKSTDRGVTWNDPANAVSPGPSLTAKNFLSISMNSNGNRGVAVGQAPDSTHGPKIRYTVTTGGQIWNDAAIGGVSVGKELREVEWAGGQTYWTAGQAGLIYVSIDDGQTWTLAIQPDTAFEIQGLAVNGPDTAVFVGKKNGAGYALIYRKTGNPAWKVVPVASGIISLSDVDMRLGGSIAYAVGIQLNIQTGFEEGVLLSCNVNSANPTLDVYSAFLPVPSVTQGEDLNSVPVLRRVRMDANANVWVAGESGRIWRTTPPGGRTELKSQTDAHIRGLSFPSTGDGFAVELSSGLSPSAYSVIWYH